MRSYLIALFGALALALTPAAAEPLDMAAIIEENAPPITRETLAAIPDTGRQLLALRSYLRAGNGLAQRWSWSDAQIAAFQGSPEQEALQAAVAAVAAHFAEANPGYEIYANTRVRSLEKQIRNWNENASVGTAAEELLAGLTNLPEPPSDVAAWLKRFKPSARAHLAAPGLTAHGQAHAIDFQIMQDGRIIAGADYDKIQKDWRGSGWDKRLKASMDAAGPAFSGPLTSPDEPWHFSYDPDT